MGGSGSTRWGLHARAPRVEECLVLDAADLARRGYRGEIRWTDNTGSDRGSIGWRRVVGGEGQRFELRYSVTPSPLQTPRDIVESVGIQRMRKPFGSFVWTFRCPLVVNGTPCNRRVLRLYLAPGGVYFGCRICHGLAYQSSLRDGDRMRRALARLGAGDELARLWRALGQGMCDGRTAR